MAIHASSLPTGGGETPFRWRIVGSWHILPTTLGERRMPTRNVVVTAHQAAMIEELVKSGRYQNASEVLREGLRLLEQRDAHFRTRLIALREAAKSGWDDIEEGGGPRSETQSVVAGVAH